MVVIPGDSETGKTNLRQNSDSLHVNEATIGRQKLPHSMRSVELRMFFIVLTGRRARMAKTGQS